jgi:hypothetical protein
MMNNSSSLVICAVLLAIMLQAAASPQTRLEPVTANLCNVLVSPAVYNQKVVAVEGVLSPSIHSLFLSSPSCKPKEGLDLTTQAVLPPSWESLPNGKQLRNFLHRGKSASVKLIGTFEADAHRYGPDGARFRFTITGILSVEKAPPGFHM